jgi:serine/threonine protein kinase
MANMMSLDIGSSEYYSAVTSFFPVEHLQGESSGSGAKFPSSANYSARIQSMLENKNAFRTALEFDIEYSKDHWTQLDSLLESEDDCEYSPEADQEYFEILKQHAQWGEFFDDFDDLVVGEKIGEGAQAEIYEAQLLHNGQKSDHYDLVVKVMKKGYALRSLQRQWPLGMLNFARSSCDFRENPVSVSGRTFKGSLAWIKGGTLLKDERLKGQFAFVMDRWWGDLRKLIDIRMQRNKNQGPPFNNDQILDLMRDIAWDMESLHSGHSMILHRDLKASNVLIFAVDVEASNQKIFNALVIDYECSIGVIGTRFWRAPEILQQLKDGMSGSNLSFTSKVDVYSYGMTCYEIVTGHMPFEDRPAQNYDYVLNGHRPELPNDIDPLVREIITRCWHPDPSYRPSFKTIRALIHQAINGRHQNYIPWEPRRMLKNDRQSHIPWEPRWMLENDHLHRPSFKKVHTLIRQAINGRRQNQITWEPCEMLGIERKSEQQIMKECKEEQEEWEGEWEKWVQKSEGWEDWKKWDGEYRKWMNLKGRYTYWNKWSDLKKSNFGWYSWKHRWEELEELKHIVDWWKDVRNRLEKRRKKLEEWVEWDIKWKKWKELARYRKDLRKEMNEWERWQKTENGWDFQNREILLKWNKWGKREWEECIEKKRKWWKDWEEWTSFVHKCTLENHLQPLALVQSTSSVK